MDLLNNNIRSRCLTPKTAFRSVSIQVQLNQELKTHMNTIANINPDTAPDITQSGTQGSHECHSQYQSGYSLVCILRYLSHRYYQFISKSSSIFQENDSGRFSFANQETIIITL